MMQRHLPARKTPKYKAEDLLTMEQVAETLGYSFNYMNRFVAPSCPEYDDDFVRMRVQTDETFRKAFRTTARYVYPYKGVVEWFSRHVQEPTVVAFNEGRGIVVE